MLKWSLTRTGQELRLVSFAVLAMVGTMLAGCTSDPPPKPVQTRYVSSGQGVDLALHAYGNPSPYGYATPWGLPDGETTGYLGANHFSPAQGLICERSRHVCYGRNGIDAAATEQYLGSRDTWNRQRLYGDAKIYVPAPQ
ncbi:hypothetical protein [Dongia sp.]|uniref:YcgJ family protein n=1 Tax=Dongia sp. TaxID=1977262 RepID=UPI0035B1CE1F